MRDLTETIISIALAVTIIGLTYHVLSGVLVGLIEQSFALLPH